MTDGFITSGHEKLSVRETWKQYIFLKRRMMKHVYNCLRILHLYQLRIDVILNNCFEKVGFDLLMAWLCKDLLMSSSKAGQSKTSNPRTLKID